MDIRKRLQAVLHCMVLLCRKCQYRCWLLFGGTRTESGFKFLSDSILKNRKMISELRSQGMDIERRLWELEDHTIDETLDMVKSKVEAWAKSVDELSA